MFRLKASRHSEEAMDPKDSPLTSSMTLRAFQGMFAARNKILKATLQKQVDCFNRRVITLVAGKLERHWL